MRNSTRVSAVLLGILAVVVGMVGCGSDQEASTPGSTMGDSTTYSQGLLVALAALDKDADGKLTPEEFAAHQAEMRQKRHHRHQQKED